MELAKVESNTQQNTNTIPADYVPNAWDIGDNLSKWESQGLPIQWEMISQKSGMTIKSLDRAMHVSRLVPQEYRRTDISWATYAELVQGLGFNRVQALKRLEWLNESPPEPYRTWTVDAVRTRLGRKSAKPQYHSTSSERFCTNDGNKLVEFYTRKHGNFVKSGFVCGKCGTAVWS